MLGPGRPTQLFFSCLFKLLAPENDSLSLRRFLTVHGEQFRGQHSDVYEAFCQDLISHLKSSSAVVSSNELILGLLEQPSLLTPTAFAGAFPSFHSGDHQSKFIGYGWREAISRALESDYPGGDKNLWNAIMMGCPEGLSREHPPTPAVRDVVLGRFKTKRELEEPWRKKKLGIHGSDIDKHTLSPSLGDHASSEYAPLLIAHGNSIAVA